MRISDWSSDVCSSDLFSEFAFTLAGAVAVSAVVALTLSPMLAARFLRAEHQEGRLVKMIDRNFDWTRNKYERLLEIGLRTGVVVVSFGFIVIVQIGRASCRERVCQ